MAANKFATKFHRNTNKFTLILIYVVLEWILILLLLLNSLFSYLIIKFAEYFGLRKPCLCCSRVDHVFEPAKQKNFLRDLLCEVHAKEISKLSYCSNHRNLVDSPDMCEDCLSSRTEFHGECSCCGVILDNSIDSSYKAMNPSLDVLECAFEQKLIEKFGENKNCLEEDYKSYEKMPEFVTDLQDVANGLENEDGAQILCDFGIDLNVAENEIEEKGSFSVYMNEMKELEGKFGENLSTALQMEEEIEEENTKNSTITMADKSIQVSIEEEKDVPLDISPHHLEFFLDNSGHRLVPIELVDSIADKQESNSHANEEDKNQENDSVWLNKESKIVVEDKFRREEARRVLDFDFTKHADTKYMMLDSMEIEEDESSLVFHAKEFHLEMGDYERSMNFQLAQTPAQLTSDAKEIKVEQGEITHSPVIPVSEEVPRISNCGTEGDVSIGTEIPDLDVTAEIHDQDYVLSHESTHEVPLATFSSFTDYHGSLQVEELKVDLKPISVEKNNEQMMNMKPSFHLQLDDIDEDKFPVTPTSSPTSVDNVQHLQKKFPLLDKRDSLTEESLDGSVTSELELGDGVVTVEHLKTALKSERKTLRALYAELEEERSASAVAASQTMAMINRLQEEKAAMQMEALQYQRMMEEQSEYDQEALQLLNELMVKREKEKQEVEKELEIYQKKVLEYETKEKMRILRRSKDGSTRSGFSSASFSNGEDSDGLSIDLNQEPTVDERYHSHLESSNQNTPVDAALDLDDSLIDFEEERVTILEQLKILEEKLMTLDIQDEKDFVDSRHMEDLHAENGIHVNGNGEAKGDHVKETTEYEVDANGLTKEMNGKHYPQRRILGSKGKQLLPIFDAISDGSANGFESNGVHNSYEPELEQDNKKLFIEEEVDHLYQRLQALEADREFLKHCIGSLRKGDKGMDLLQEILQHLRDLRNVELRARNFTDAATI